MLKILIPTDFSANARMAIDYVYKHFKSGQTEVKIIHTVKAPASTAGVLIRIDDLMRKDAEIAMAKELIYIKENYGASPETVLRFGYLKDWVNSESKNGKIDLVVMGTKGESNVSSKLMGSVTESMIRGSEVPVLAVPELETDSRLHHVVITTDDLQSKQNEGVVKFLRNMKLEIPTLTYLHVDTGKDKDPIPKSLPLGGYQINVEVEKNNSVVDGINDFLDRRPTDMLVLFHKRSSMFDYLFNLSVTKSICARTKVPILVLPGRG